MRISHTCYVPSTELSTGNRRERRQVLALGELAVWWGTDQYIIHLRALTLPKFSGGIKGGFLEKETAKLRLEEPTNLGKGQGCSKQKE